MQVSLKKKSHFCGFFFYTRKSGATETNTSTLTMFQLGQKKNAPLFVIIRKIPKFDFKRLKRFNPN
jgi:hypothetical protein